MNEIKKHVNQTKHVKIYKRKKINKIKLSPSNSHFIKVVPSKFKDKMHQKDKSRQRGGSITVETVKYNVRIGQGELSFITSITLRKNVIALWITMMDKIEENPHQLVQEFIDKVCLARWEGASAKGMSDFVTKCMIHSFLDEMDFKVYKKVYFSL
jgi:hypothetical protein